MSTCSIAGCDKPVFARGWCNSHYLKWHRYGDPLHGRFMGLSADERFWSKVNKSGTIPNRRPDLGPCWEWTGSKLPEGYGTFRVSRDLVVRVHRYVYEITNGAIPDGETVDHLCFNTSCVNPAHLEAVSNATNVLRGGCPPAENSRKTHCYKGHELTPENTYLNSGGRYCRICRRENKRSYYLRKKQRLKADSS